MERREVDAGLLADWALGYLGRYASSAENLRRVMLRRVRRRFQDDGEAIKRVAPLIDEMVVRLSRSGLLDDAAYAARRVEALHRRGEPMIKIRARLAAKGVCGEVAEAALAGLRNGAANPDLAAACAFARRRRLGPYRRAGADPARELAAFARAGFSRRLAEAVLACRDSAAAEALAESQSY